MQPKSANLFFSARMALSSIAFFEAYYALMKEWDRPYSFTKLSKYIVFIFSTFTFIYTIVLSLAL